MTVLRLLGHEATLGWTTPDLVFRNDTGTELTIETSHTSTSVTVQLIGVSGGRTVQTSVAGSATTYAGGTVTVTRTVGYSDGESTTQTWTHHYNPIPQDDDGGGGGDPDPGPGPIPL